MPHRDVLLPEFDREMSTTRALLERVPADRADWRPHPKSRPLGQLAMHLTQIPRLATRAMRETEVDAGSGGPPPRLESTAGLLAAFDESVSAMRRAIESVSDDDLRARFTFKAGGKEIFSVPRTAMLRTFLLNHMIHHRGQLTVYLRLNDVPLPSIYGPTADEPL